MIPVTKQLILHKPKANKDAALQSGFYAKLTARGIADIFRFVNEQCHFLSALTSVTTALCQEGRRREQPDGRYYCLGFESWQSEHGRDQRYSLSRPGSDLPAILTVIDIAGQQ
jgi:hypothetical protein